MIFEYFAAAAAVSAVSIYWGSMRWLKVSRHKVALDGLPDFLDGFRILHISDLHGDDPKKMNLNIWKKIETLDFDMAVITGDVIIDDFMEILPHMEGLEAMAERAPVYYVEGNHDRRCYKKLIEFFETLGIRTLTNESVLHTPNGKEESFEIIGICDLDSMRDRNYEFGGVLPLFEKAGSGFRLVLTHEPLLYDKIGGHGTATGRAAETPQLVLAGHTHGGQIRLPFFPTLYAPRQGLFPKYGDGFYGDGGSKLYISKGVGTTVFPVRFWNRPEITVLKLSKG